MRRALLAFALLATLGAALLLALTTTATGAAWTLALLRHWLPGDLTYTQVEGSLHGPLQVRGLRYTTETFSADIDRLQLVPRLSRLLAGTLDIETASIQGLRVVMKPGGAQTPPSPPQRLVPLLKLRARDLQVHDLALTPPAGAAPITLKRIAVSLTADGHALRIARLDLTRADGELRTTGNIDMAGDYAIRLDTAWEVRLPDRPPVRGHGTVMGNLRSLAIEQTVDAPAGLAVSATVSDLLGVRHWRASVSIADVEPTRLDPAWPAMVLRGKVEAADEGAGVHLRSNLDAEVPQYGSWNLAAAIRQRSTAVWQIERWALSQGERSVSGDGTLNWDGGHPPKLEMQGQWRNLAWPLSGKPRFSSVAGSFSLSGGLSDYQLRAKARLGGKALPAGEWQLLGHGDSRSFAVEQLSGQTLGGQIEAVANLGWRPSMQLHAHVDWQQLTLPLNAPRRIESPQGSFSLDADSLDHYTFSLKADTRSEKLPAIAWSVSGHGSRAEVVLDEALARGLQGTLHGKGTINLSPNTGWTFKLDGKDFDPSAQWSQWKGRLALTAQTEGRIADGQVQGSLSISQLNGQLRGYPFSANAQLDLSGDILRLERLNLSSGHSRLTASGRLNGKRLSGEWSLTSRNLAELLPDAGGRLESHGRIGGSPDALVVEATLHGTDLRLADLNAGDLSSTLSISDVGTRSFKLDLKAGKLSFKQHTLNSLSVAGSGTAQAHRIELHAAGSAGRAELSARGGLTGTNWAGHIDQAMVAGKPIGEWHLSQAYSLEAGRDHVRAERQCWQSGTQSKGASRLCFDGEWHQAGDWLAHLDAKAFDLARLDPWLPTAVTGAADARLEIAGSKASLSSVDGEVHVVGGHIRLLKRYAATPEVFAFRSADLSVHGQDKDKNKDTQLTATLTVVPQEEGMSPLRGALRLPTLAVTRQTPMDGDVSVAMTDLGWVGTVFPDLDEVKGKVDAKLKIAGQVGRPRLLGKISVAGSATVPRYGLQLRRIELTGSGNDAGLDLNGSVDSGEGILRLTGRADLDAAKGWPLKLHIEGERFKAVDIPEAWMLVSPKLDLTSAGRDIRLRGSVTIPEAKLEPKLESGAVPLSKDVVLVTDKTDRAAAEAQKGWRIDTQVKLIFGDKVSLKTPILNGRLSGSLLVRDTGDAAATGSGELQIVDGDIGAYGQKLKIDRGRIVFAGGPLDDPGLDLRAIRSVGSVTAGVLIQGRLNQPSTSLFSQPAMSDADALSYLLLGQSMQQGSAADGQTLLQAAASMGLEHSDLVTERIAHTFGLEHVSVQKDSTSGNLALSIGKYLAPRLYVSYGLGLLQSTNVVRLRYELSRRWSIEADSGTGTGADILYNLER